MSIADLLKDAQGKKDETKGGTNTAIGKLLTQSVPVSKYDTFSADSEAKNKQYEADANKTDYLGIAKNLPSATGQVIKESITHPLNTGASLLAGAADVGPTVFNSINNLGAGILNSIFGTKNKGLVLPKAGEAINNYNNNNSDVQKTIRDTSTQVAGYELGGAATKSLGFNPVTSRILGNVVGGQATSEAQALHDRAKQAAIDAAVGVITEGLTGGFKAPKTNVGKLIEETKQVPVVEKPFVEPQISGKTPLVQSNIQVPESPQNLLPSEPTLGKPRASGLKPIEGTGEIKTRSLSQGVEANAIEKELTNGFGDLPQYKQVSMVEQAQRASEMVNYDYETAKQVALGEKAPPKGLLPESVFVAVEKKAVQEGDATTLRNLATRSSLSSEATTMGQRIRTLAERDPESPVGAIADISKARETALKGQDVPKLRKEVVSQIKESIKETSPKNQNWSEFVDSITC